MGAQEHFTAGKRNKGNFTKGATALTNAQLDAVKDAIDTSAWHELNKEDPATKEALDLIRNAISEIENAERYLNEAANKVDNTPEHDRIESLRYGLEDLECEIRKQVRRMGGQA